MILCDRVSESRDARHCRWCDEENIEPAMLDTLRGV